MKTSKIREQLSYRKYRTYNYVAELPSQEKWLVEHVSGSHDIETLRKPIEFKDVGMPSYDEVEWFDEFGVKSSNVDWTYDPNDYEFYKVTYEVIDCNDEDNDMIQSYEDYEYVYTDKYVEFDASRFKEDIDEMANEIRDVRSLDDGENYYGDSYPDDVYEIKTTIEAKSMSHELKEEEYRDYLEAIRQEFNCCARSYLDKLKEELDGWTTDGMNEGRREMEKQYIWRGHKVRIIDTWVDVDNNKKGVTIEPVGNYGFPIDVYLDDLKKGKEEIEIK